MAATAVIPAGETTLVVPIIADPANGGIANVQMPGAVPIATRGDRSADLYAIINSGDGYGGRFENYADSVTGSLPNPLTYDEYQALVWVANRAVPPNEVGSSDFVLAAAAARTRLNSARIDWRTVPEAKASTIAGGTVFSAVLAGAGWAKTEQKVQGLIEDLGDPDFTTRQNAQAELEQMALTSLTRGDLARAALIYDRICAAVSNANPEIGRRALDLARRINGQAGMEAFWDYKIRAAAAVTGASVYSLP